MSSGIARVISIAGIVISVGGLVVAARTSRREMRVRGGFEAARVLITLAVLITMSQITAVTTPIALTAPALLLGATFGVAQGRALKLSISNEQVMAKRTFFGLAVWGASLLVMQLSSVLAQTGAFRFGQALSYFSIAATVGTFLTRNQRVQQLSTASFGAAAGIAIALLALALAVAVPMSARAQCPDGPLPCDPGGGEQPPAYDPCSNPNSIEYYTDCQHNAPQQPAPAPPVEQPTQPYVPPVGGPAARPPEPVATPRPTNQLVNSEPGTLNQPVDPSAAGTAPTGDLPTSTTPTDDASNVSSSEAAGANAAAAAGAAAAGALAAAEGAAGGFPGRRRQDDPTDPAGPPPDGGFWNLVKRKASSSAGPSQPASDPAVPGVLQNGGVDPATAGDPTIQGPNVGSSPTVRGPGWTGAVPVTVLGAPRIASHQTWPGGPPQTWPGGPPQTWPGGPPQTWPGVPNDPANPVQSATDVGVSVGQARGGGETPAEGAAAQQAQAAAQQAQDDAQRRLIDLARQRLDILQQRQDLLNAQLKDSRGDIDFFNEMAARAGWASWTIDRSVDMLSAMASGGTKYLPTVITDRVSPGQILRNGYQIAKGVALHGSDPTSNWRRGLADGVATAAIDIVSGRADGTGLGGLRLPFQQASVPNAADSSVGSVTSAAVVNAGIQAAKAYGNDVLIGGRVANAIQGQNPFTPRDSAEQALAGTLRNAANDAIDAVKRGAGLPR